MDGNTAYKFLFIRPPKLYIIKIVVGISLKMRVSRFSVKLLSLSNVLTTPDLYIILDGKLQLHLCIVTISILYMCFIAFFLHGLLCFMYVMHVQRMSTF